MDALIIRGASSAASAFQSLFSSGSNKLEKVATDPKAMAAFIYLFFFSHIAIITLGGLVMVCTEWGRKKLRKYWRLSQQGPFHRLVVWLVNLGVRLLVFITGDALYQVPKEKPRFTTIQTQVNRIVLKWQAKPSSRWTQDSYVLEMASSSPQQGMGKGGAWVEQYKGTATECDICDLPEASEHKFRLRTLNNKGHSDWCEGTFETRQRPVINGGAGPGYTWRQTTKELQVVVGVSEGSKGKDFEVSCKGGILVVKEGGRPLIEGELWKAVKGSELSWSLGTSDDDANKGKKVMFLTLEKMEKTNRRKDHWQCLVKGHTLLDSRFLPDCIIPSGRMPDETEI